MDSHRLDGTRAIREAQEWICLLATPDEAVNAAFGEWVKASPDNLKAYLTVTFLNAERTGVNAATKHGPQPTNRNMERKVTTLHARTLSHSSDTPRTAALRTRSSGLRSRWWIAAAAAAFAAILISQVVPKHFAASIHTVVATDIGERRRVELPDRSTLQLNTNSRARIDFTATRRDVTLEKGELLVSVGADTTRPFRLRTVSIEIQDIGTAFGVRVEPHETRVYVIQGRVRVTPLAKDGAAIVKRLLEARNVSTFEVGGGEEAVIDTTDNGLPATFMSRNLTAPELQKRIAWIEGKMVLTGEPLSTVVREINRYHRIPIVITDPELGTLSMGGTIDPATNDYRVIVHALATSCPIIVDDSDRATIRITTGRGPRCSLGK